jgi:hypothetical protein
VLYPTLTWHGPFPLASYDFSLVPPEPGVYIFTEFSHPLKPNAPIPTKDHPDYERAMETFRITPCVLYVGKAGSRTSNLRTRLSGYRLNKFLRVDKHKGRALLHAHQIAQSEILTGPIFLWWAVNHTPKETESILIKELNPVLNTHELVLLEPE